MAQQGAAVAVQLHRHQARGEFHHVRLQAQVLQGVGGFQTEQATADDNAGFAALGTGANGIEVVQGAVDEAVRVLAALNRRHEREGAGGQHQFVVAVLALVGGHGPAVPVQASDGLVQVQVDALFGVPVGGAHGQVGVGGAGEVLGQVHPVVGQLLLLAEHQDLVLGTGVGGDELLEEVMANHAIANHDQGFLAHGVVLSPGTRLRPRPRKMVFQRAAGPGTG